MLKILLKINIFFLSLLFFTLPCFSCENNNRIEIKNDVSEYWDSFFKDFKKEFQSSHIEIKDNIVSIYPQLRLYNFSAELMAMLTAWAMFYLQECFVMPYDTSSSVKTFKEITIILLTIASVLVTSYGLYNKFGFDGSLFKLGAEGFFFKEQKIFDWKDLKRCYISERSIADSSFEVLNFYDYIGKELFEVSRSDVALPKGVSFYTLKRLIKYYLYTYGGKKINFKVESELGTTVTH